MEICRKNNQLLNYDVLLWIIHLAAHKVVKISSTSGSCDLFVLNSYATHNNILFFNNSGLNIHIYVINSMKFNTI